jgi:H/ACA ribonucleoprotein complex non-core subunit NAF1
MDVFKKPLDLPQDLLLIQDLIGVPDTRPPPPPPQIPKVEAHTESTDDDDISSSDSDVASEDEIEAELVGGQDKDNGSDQYVPKP